MSCMYLSSGSYPGCTCMAAIQASWLALRSIWLLPYCRFNCSGFEPRTQCAAVSTQREFNNVAPQECAPVLARRSDNWRGRECVNRAPLIIHWIFLRYRETRLGQLACHSLSCHPADLLPLLLLLYHDSLLLLLLHWKHCRGHPAVLLLLLLLL